MKFGKHILGLILLLSAWVAPVLSQEYTGVVCAGDTGVAYYVDGWEESTYNWSVTGGTITRHFGDSVIVDWGNEPGEYEITVQEVSVHGCKGEIKRASIVVSAPTLNLGADTLVCSGELFTVAPAGEFNSYLWQDGSTSPSYSTGEEGVISLTVTDAYGCLRSDELYLSVANLPLVELGPDTSLCGDQSLLLDGGPDGVRYEWSTGEISREINVYHGQQEVWVLVENEYGCLNSDTMMIEECDINDFFSDIPNAITPSNPDGVNDVWRIEKLQGYPDAVVDIYDRWGRLIWRSEPGYPQAWDGTTMRGNPVPMDSYHFVIMLNYMDLDRITGTVTVIR